MLGAYPLLIIAVTAGASRAVAGIEALDDSHLCSMAGRRCGENTRDIEQHASLSAVGRQK
jgi:hypothetical protein